MDGALAFGHIVVDLRSLECDYYAASFHKWAGGPTATGFFYASGARQQPDPRSTASLGLLMGSGRPRTTRP